MANLISIGNGVDGFSPGAGSGNDSRVMDS